MTRNAIATMTALLADGHVGLRAARRKADEPAGTAQVQVLGKWAKGERPGVHARPRELPGRQVDRDHLRPAAPARARSVWLRRELRQGGARRRRARLPGAAGLARRREQTTRLKTRSAAGLRRQDGAGGRIQPLHRLEAVSSGR